MNPKKMLIGAVSLLSVVGIPVYFYASSERNMRLELVFDTTNIPCIPVDIQGVSYLLAMDFGATFDLKLKKEVMDTLRKTSPSFESRMDVWGDERYQLKYQIDDVRLGNVVFSGVKALEMTRKQAEREASVPIRDHSKKIEKEGFIGAPLLAQANLLIDFPGFVAITVKDKKKLKEMGYSLEHFTKVPFLKKSNDILIKTSTSIGDVNLLLDTGCTYCIVNSSLVSEKTFDDGDCFKSLTFSMGGRDFGAINLYPLEISPDFTEDGILGMDFLSKHIIYIDQEEQAIYIGDHAQSDAQP